MVIRTLSAAVLFPSLFYARIHNRDASGVFVDTVFDRSVGLLHTYVSKRDNDVIDLQRRTTGDDLRRH
jgi:hypothetical protein